MTPTAAPVGSFRGTVRAPSGADPAAATATSKTGCNPAGLELAWMTGLVGTYEPVPAPGYVGGSPVLLHWTPHDFDVGDFGYVGAGIPTDPEASAQQAILVLLGDYCCLPVEWLVQGTPVEGETLIAPALIAGANWLMFSARTHEYLDLTVANYSIAALVGTQRVGPVTLQVL